MAHNDVHPSMSDDTTLFPREDVYKAQLDIANKEKAQLQERLREVENRNAVLVKALFELSCAPPGSTITKSMPIDVVQALKKMSASSDQNLLQGKGSAYRRAAPLERALSNMSSSYSRAGPHVSPDFTPFCVKAELNGHTSAVYTIQFSPNGRLLVSTSFDKSVCFWAIDRFLDKSNYEPKVSIPDAHRAPVVAVEWTFDSARVVSGSLDQSVAEWDVCSESKDPISRFLCCGLVKAVSVSPANDNLFFVGTSKNVVHLFDRRVPPPVPATSSWDSSKILVNDTLINSIHVTLDGSRFITGDDDGAIKTWDLRMVGSTNLNGVGERKAELIHTTYNENNHHAISHVHTSPPTSDDDYGRFMAVNSYDNCLRVYDRGSFLFKAEKPELKLVHALPGVQNTHWPIKSSFFLGADYQPPRTGRRRPPRTRRSREPSTARVQREEESDPIDINGTTEESALDDSTLDEHSSFSSSSECEGDEKEQDDSDLSGHSGRSIQSSLILASGSADSNIYVFDVGGRAGSGCLLQMLRGHKDRVYSVDFHPSEPILASCSADSTIKIWQ